MIGNCVGLLNGQSIPISEKMLRCEIGPMLDFIRFPFFFSKFHSQSQKVNSRNGHNINGVKRRKSIFVCLEPFTKFYCHIIIFYCWDIVTTITITELILI